jgi:hypothetical protein
MHQVLPSLQILAQVFLLAFSAAGWAYWIWCIPAVRRHSGERFFWVFLAAAGFSVGILALQNLFYLGCRLGVTGWFAFAAATIGNFCWVRACRKDRGLAARAARGSWRAAALGLGVFLIQSCALFYSGPSNYYGRAHIDQVNYVLVSQFIVDRPNAFQTTRADPKLQPYEDIAIGFLRQRMGQSVEIGYLSVVSWCNAKSAYGVISTMALGLAAVAVYVLLQTFGVPWRLAMLAGVWWGLLPGITKMGLDGFLSQACYAWTLPLSVALFVRSSRKLGGNYLVFQAIFHGYVMSVYPEMFVISVSTIAGLLVIASRATPGRRLLALTAPPVCGLLSVGWYLTLFFNTLAMQYRSAAADTSVLSVLVPWSGTWLGWSEIFFGLYFIPPVIQRAVILLAVGMLAVMALGLFSAKRNRRLRLLAAIAAPVAILAVFSSAPVFPKYGFAKLLITCSPFWVLLFVTGCFEFRYFLPRGLRRYWMQLAPAMFVIGAAALALVDDFQQWSEICRSQGHLSVINTPMTRRCFKYAEANKSPTYVIAEEHPILNAWFAYHCRNAKTYVLANAISDLPPTPFDTFRVLPEHIARGVVLSRDGVELSGATKAPLMIITNPQGVEFADGVKFEWLGDAPEEISLYNLFADPGRTPWNLHVEAFAGPANPRPDREIGLTTADGTVEVRRFSAHGVFEFPIFLQPGLNHLSLQALHSPEQVVHIPGDPRNHMVLIRALAVSPAR